MRALIVGLLVGFVWTQFYTAILAGTDNPLSKVIYTVLYAAGLTADFIGAFRLFGKRHM